MGKLKFTISFLLLFICGTLVIKAQIITGVWTRKIDHQKVEVKIILKGLSLTGTSCYYESPDNFLRYRIKGYFDPGRNEAVWWEDQLTEETVPGSPGEKKPLLSRAHFDFPGYGRLMLGGKAHKVDNQYARPGAANFDKPEWPTFTDEWEFMLENFTMEAIDLKIIDSVDLVTPSKKTIEDQPVKSSGEEVPIISIPEPTQAQIEFLKPDSTITVLPVDSILASAIEQIYTARKKVFATEIPVSGDSVEFHFYDNAQVDGDSISLFLNGKLIFEHIRLTDKAYSIKLAVAELKSSNELVMVAENEGFIPPNTSYMVATVGDKRYEARLESTEGSSALVRLVKPTDSDNLH